MNIYLCGQRDFGAETLALLRRLGHRVLGVSAPRENHSGGGIRPDRLWASATTLNIPLLPAGELREWNLPAGVDLIIAAHSHDFIGRRTRQAARLGAIGYHPSLLPLHRGRDAVKWTLRFSDRIAGGSVYWLDDVVDGGPIAAQDWCFVRPDDTPGALWRRELLPLGLRLFEETLYDIERGRLVKIPQDAALATWEPALDPPSLGRPELPQLTDGRRLDFQIVTSK